MTLSKKQVQAVLQLPAPQRYGHFVKKVVGWRKLWGLYADGWAMSETPSGSLVLPLWPEREYAELCVGGDWNGYEPKPVDLDDALENMFPMLRERGIQPGVFFTLDHGSVSVTVDELERDLRAELEKYS